jgi:hypothetical protein
MKKEKITIVLPPVASSDIDMDLVNLTEYLTKKVFRGKWQGGGLLGGEFGYGVEFENDVFMMKPFCWCEQDDCLWCAMNDKNLQVKLIERFKDKGWAKMGIAPNFWYKPSGLLVRWYKWIGRDTEFNKKPSKKEWQKIYNDCIKSV